MSTFSKFSYNDLVDMVCQGDIYPFLDLVQDSVEEGETNQIFQGSASQGEAVQKLLEWMEDGRIFLQVNECHRTSGMIRGCYADSEEDPRNACRIKFSLSHQRELLGRSEEAGLERIIWSWVNRACCGEYVVKNAWMLRHLSDQELLEQDEFHEMALEMRIEEGYDRGATISLVWYIGDTKRCDSQQVASLVRACEEEVSSYDDIPF